MRRVKYYRRELAHDGQRAHVHDQIVVAETRSSLGHKHLTIPGITALVDSVLHVPGRNELPLLDVHRTPAERRRHNQVGLAAEKCRNLQNVDNLSDGSHVGRLMHIGEHRNVHFVFHLFQNAQAFLDPRPAVAADRGAVRLVVRGFEDERKVEGTHHALDDLRHAQGVLFALNHTRPGNEEQVSGADANVIDLEGQSQNLLPPRRREKIWPSGHRVIKTRAVFDRPMARWPDHPIYLLPTFSGRKNISTSAASFCTFFFCPCSYEVPTNALNSGCGSSGFDLNSGWNWHPVKNG